MSRIPSRRVAGRDAAGLRLRPSDSGTTIDRVDVWVDPATGLRCGWRSTGRTPRGRCWRPRSSTSPRRTPPPSTTRFTPAEPGKIRGETNPDLAAAINVFAPVVPPATLAGLPGRPGIIGLGSIGTYGSGLTLLVAVPLPGRISRPLRDQLAKTPGRPRLPRAYGSRSARCRCC